jgi:hypothetical protein
LRSIIAGRCVRRTSPSAPKQPDPIAVWARAVVENPAAHCATEREAAQIAELLRELEVA